MSKQKITIAGNWREGGPDDEWAGDGTVDADGVIECWAALGDEVYELIEEQIADGDTQGSVTVHSEEQDRDITYRWSFTDCLKWFVRSGRPMLGDGGPWYGKTPPAGTKCTYPGCSAGATMYSFEGRPRCLECAASR